MKTTSRDYQRFLLALCACLALGVLASIALVVIVDPYGLYGVVDRPGFNAVKPGLSRYQVQIKQAHAVRLHPRVIILGNSRAEIGLDPAAPAFAAAHGAVYNLAIPGTGLGTSSHQLTQLLAAGLKPTTVILGIEFMDFLALKSPPASTAKPGATPFWQFDALFSLASVKDALHTLRIQHDAEAATLSADGFNPLRDYGTHVRNDGYHKMFTQRARKRRHLEKKIRHRFDTGRFHAVACLAGAGSRQRCGCQTGDLSVSRAVAGDAGSGGPVAAVRAMEGAAGARDCRCQGEPPRGIDFPARFQRLWPV